MRKTKLNFLTKLLFISVSLLFYGCLNEEVVDKIEKQYKYNVEIVSIDKVMHLNQNIQNFNQRKKAKSATNDSIDLDLSRILVLTNNETNYTSYSIVINQQNSNVLFENFHVTQNLDGTQEEFIFQWIPENLSIPFELQNYSGIVNKLDTNYNLIFSNEYINGVLQNPYNNQSNKSNPDYDTPDYQYYCETVIDCSSNECNCYDSYPCTISTVCYLGSGGSGNGSGNGFGGGLGGDGGGGGSNNTGEGNDGLIGNNGDPLHPVIPLPEMEEENPLDCVTKEKLHEIFPSSSLENRTKLANNIRIYGGYFGINTKEEVCHFLAQVGAETGGLTTLNATENLNYTTASRLVQVFPSKFSLTTHPTKVSPIPYLNNPSGLANLVYCCQYGNGDVTSGDGWKYRGRGVLQLTWKGNYLGYENYLNDIGLDWFYYGPDNLSDINGIHSVLSGMWFFKKNVLDIMTINNTTPVKKVSKKINPALEKLNERKNYFNKAITVLNC